ncbi:hypothetical protein PHAVU_001G032600 [Phaseolus vulgaris]|uniref:Uncharacterized protein n=1 Tax=Phaseolus vulgaris TaxID=3885 RepID=V7CUK3_PHAVU|nr:hypothetical protein PHAVU_001G032600g [Phaseolus vulgaris]ESW32965.1 hypothetical protein PHAVU_001G032600g [Phaseolus vulgaris]
MGRAPCCDKANVKRGPWSPEEDAALKTYVDSHGTGGNWIALPKKAGLRRCGKSCRLRWLNYLRPDIKHGGFTEEEDNIICNLYGQMGSRWSAIASKLHGRTDNDVKNYWNTKLKKKMIAGKVCLKTFTENGILPSTSTPLPTNQSLNIQNSPFNASPNQTLVPPILEANDNNAFTIDQNSFISFDQTNHHEVMHGGAASSRINKNTNDNNSNSHMVSLSQEGSSSISDSSSIAMNYNKCVVSQPQQQQQQQSDESMDKFMDFGFGFPYDFANGANCHYERVGEVFAPEWVDFSYADIKPH